MVRPPAHLETRLVHAADMSSAFAGAKVTPIVRSTVFEARENESYGDVRISTGIEHIEDLLADFEQALESAAQVSTP